MSLRSRCVLISIDGWGLTDKKDGDATVVANIPCMRRLLNGGEGETVFARLDASGLAVGLPPGVMGNSEVGHLTMGAGRVDFQDLVRINLSIEQKTLGSNETLVATFERARKGNGRLHLLGLVSDGGVHSHISHVKALLAEAAKAGVPKCFVHFFADGRDTPPKSATTYLADLLSFLRQARYGSLATVMGRFYAMDRDKRWERTKEAYEALVGGKGEATTAEQVVAAVEKRYAADESDEFLKPLIVDKDGIIRESDTLIFFDFRADRMRQIVETLGVKPPFAVDTPLPANLGVVQMTQYNKDFPLPVIFKPQVMDNVLAEWLSKQGLRQFHTAETEKYAHVTFFFNGGREKAFDNEDRVLVPSPKVATYDLKPEMSVAAVGVEVCKAIESGTYPFVMCNLAPPDMVGHTGVFDATVKACEATDVVIERIVATCAKHGYTLVITADHGNCEDMIDEDGRPKTSHSTNLVPLLIVNDKGVRLVRKEGGLSDVAPTVLTIMGLPVPKEMTGKSMVEATGPPR
jgi:2,3-bisphosphoglycerate-independent phosphoglycerate mutase